MNSLNSTTVSMLPLGVVDRGFDPHSGQDKDYKIDNSWFFPKLTTLKSKNNDWLVQSLQVDMSLHQGTLS